MELLLIIGGERGQYGGCLWTRTRGEYGGCNLVSVLLAAAILENECVATAKILSEFVASLD